MAIKALIAASLAATLTLGTANTASAQTIKIGVVNTLSGGSATLGEMIEKGYKLYLKLHEINELLYAFFHFFLTEPYQSFCSKLFYAKTCHG